MKRVTDLNTIDPQLRACIEQELANLPGALVIERKGRLFLKGKNGFELCELKARWCALVEHAPMSDARNPRGHPRRLIRRRCRASRS